MVDIQGAKDAHSLTLDDFDFRVGVSSDLTTWVPAPAPTMNVRSGAGTGGADRVTFIWPNRAIQKKWLQVRVKSDARTLLAKDDVFYFGNALGETGNAAGQTLVTSVDVIQTRDNQRGPFDLAPITDRFDFNRDRIVSSVDVILARNNQTGPLTALILISPPTTTLVAAVAANVRRVDQIMGDINLDGLFDSSDLVQLFQLGYCDVPQRTQRAKWSAGDWDGDGDFDSSDLVLLLQNARSDYETRR
jgi:hypothetical protein